MTMQKKMYRINKLLRDEVHLLLAQGDATVSIRTLNNNDDFKVALQAKVLEEIQELFEAQQYKDIVEEYADVEEVLSAFRKLYGISQEEIEEARIIKKQKRGGYDKRLFGSVVSCEIGSRWHECAIKNGYPEISEHEYQTVCAQDGKMCKERE